MLFRSLLLEKDYRSYINFLINRSDTFRDKFVTTVETENGLLFYTQDKKKLEQVLQRLMLS